jgi:hypothetical protein
MNLKRNLRAHWRLDEGGASVPVDAFGGKVVSVVGTQPGSFAGKLGLARGQFATGKRYTILPNSDADFDIRGHTAMSCTFWVYHTDETTTHSAVEIWDTDAQDKGFIVRYDHTFDIWAFVIVGSTAGSIGNPVVNTWNFVGVSYDPDLDLQRCYLNGDINEKAWAGGFPHTRIISPAHWKMGGVTAQGLDGYLDSLSWWKNRALTKREFDFLYRNGAGRDLAFFTASEPATAYF